ncbi:unnamed protein product [Darwinula stevensoni]|uniref:PID domain-containing protein n=1 Tax=Darwinula stevensoni TaxID=69355 RepID=A0A7R9A9G9_9CRUS|nr:unnamed protein product [Darwinula stevensoni]CAG0897385.1 unnamed protein product [Darwinula stevensoni]
MQEEEKSAVPSEVPLPCKFTVKALGWRDAMGLWGIKHTRAPVDELVANAKKLKQGDSLPFVQLEVRSDGVHVSAQSKSRLVRDHLDGFTPINLISYGVQDVSFTRVFAMIVVQEGNLKEVHPFRCHAFVCDSRESARRLTFAVATAFREFSKSVKGKKAKPAKFAIDLRSPEEIQAEMEGREVQDSEA